MQLVLCDDNRILYEALAVTSPARSHEVAAIATTGIARFMREAPDAIAISCQYGSVA